MRTVSALILAALFATGCTADFVTGTPEEMPNQPSDPVEAGPEASLEGGPEPGLDGGPDADSAIPDSCGDGVVTAEDGEVCDDGHGGGCAADCSAFAGTCGDGLVALDEACDDGDSEDGDGCSDECTIEHGFACDDAEPSVCTSTCGDGVVASDEGCDDGGEETGDGCDADCSVEHGWACDAEPSECSDSCGDGVVEGSEDCDDGANEAGDGCSVACKVEHGYACSGEPSVCDCAADFFAEGAMCIDQRSVDCSTQGTPANAVADVVPVTVRYTDAGGWEDPAACAWSCAPDYAQDGDSCINSRLVPCNASSTPSNATAVNAEVTVGYTDAAGWASPSACAWNCNANYTNENGACIDRKMVSCDATGTPANATSVQQDVSILYTDATGWSAPAACSWSCNANYFRDGDRCINRRQVSCDSSGTPNNASPDVRDVTIRYTDAGGWSSPEACSWTCDRDYYQEGLSCINFRQVECDASGTPSNATAQIAIVATTYTDANGWTAVPACEWACDRFYTENASGTRCVDENECNTGNHACDVFAECSNRTQGYDCTCKEGFVGDGDVCRGTIADIHDHSLFVHLANGNVEAWGSHRYGQLGVGDAAGSEEEQGGPIYVDTTVDVGAFSGALQIASGREASCALMPDRSLWCTGTGNDVGIDPAFLPDECRNGDACAKTPIQIGNAAGGSRITVGSRNACIIMRGQTNADNRGGCWGYRHSANSRAPGLNSDYDGVIQFADAGDTICALHHDGTVWCDGFNRYGQAGLGHMNGSFDPVQVPGLGKVVQIGAGGNAVCALEEAGTVKCWGEADDGRLGTGVPTSTEACGGGSFACVPNPAPVVGLDDITQLSVGDGHSCALHEDGTLSCWGRNGGLGIGVASSGGRATPVKPDIRDVVEVHAGDFVTCALTDSGGDRRVMCTGSAQFGQVAGHGDDFHTTFTEIDLRGNL